MRYSPVLLAVLVSFSGSSLAENQNIENEIETIDVVGRAFSLYRPTESSFGTRTNTPIEKIPQSIQIYLASINLAGSASIILAG
ncbi:hypothetical protein [Pseudoalteromonas sp. D48-MNA-CIBAN-0056]|uniref:hypothetical protein n=1 Tax=Pseudoalteromonas sp. D48-MNA-CIBAN-0056 TaxID=3140417 RepID=UPI003319C240